MVGELAHTIRATVGIDPARGVDSVAGNHAVLREAGAVMFAHLRPREPCR